MEPLSIAKLEVKHEFNTVKSLRKSYLSPTSFTSMGFYAVGIPTS